MRDGKFLQNLSTHNSVINSLAVNEDGVCASGGDDGTLHFTDYQSGYNFQKIKSVAQPGNNHIPPLCFFHYYHVFCWIIKYLLSYFIIFYYALCVLYRHTTLLLTSVYHCTILTQIVINMYPISVQHVLHCTFPFQT